MSKHLARLKNLLHQGGTCHQNHQNLGLTPVDGGFVGFDGSLSPAVADVLPIKDMPAPEGAGGIVGFDGCPPPTFPNYMQVACRKVDSPCGEGFIGFEGFEGSTPAGSHANTNLDTCRNLDAACALVGITANDLPAALRTSLLILPDTNEFYLATLIEEDAAWHGWLGAPPLVDYAPGGQHYRPEADHHPPPTEAACADATTSSPMPARSMSPGRSSAT